MLNNEGTGLHSRPHGIRRWAVAAVLAAAGVAASPAAATAQDGMTPAGSAVDEASGSTLELTGYVGVALPMSVLGAQGDTLEAELSTKPSFSAGLELWFGNGFGLGVTGGLASPELSLTTADSETGMQDVADLGTADYLHGEALLLWRPQLKGSAAALLPYFGAGAGVRRLEFEADSGFEDTTDVAIVLNAGAHIPISDRVHMRLDLRDLISSFEGGPFGDSNLQHDIFAQVGLGIGL